MSFVYNYKKSSISEECDIGFYGEQCTQKCSEHCAGEDNRCRHDNGTCELGCDSGYQEALCTTSKFQSIGKKKQDKVLDMHDYYSKESPIALSPLRVAQVKDRNTCYEGGFFSEDSSPFGSPASFFIHVLYSLATLYGPLCVLKM